MLSKMFIALHPVFVYEICFCSQSKSKYVDEYLEINICIKINGESLFF
jgi:hypothetical protein